jgi:hypothetical protein
MKYILTILLATALVSVASAQNNYPNDNYGYGRNNRWHFQIFRGDNGYADHDIDRINRYYDEKVWGVQNDFSLRPREKRRIIREINEERKYRHKAERRQDWGERRHWDDDDD